MITISCATQPPVEPVKTQPAVFETAESVRARWEAFADGVDFFHGMIVSPNIEFWALQIDLASPVTRIVVKGGAMKDGQAFSAKVSGFVSDNSLVAGINAVPFDIASSREGQPIKNMGIVISGGNLIAPANPSYDALVFYKDGKAAIVSQSSIISTENIENAAGGFHQILVKGEPAQRTLDRDRRAPRSAAGISANGEYLYLAVIDGMRSRSIGGTEKETAFLLRSLGSWDAINLDGGGSSALALRYQDGKVKTVNTPTHDGIPGQERAVAGCIGISLSTGR